MFLIFLNIFKKIISNILFLIILHVYIIIFLNNLKNKLKQVKYVI